MDLVAEKTGQQAVLEDQRRGTTPIASLSLMFQQSTVTLKFGTAARPGPACTYSRFPAGDWGCRPAGSCTVLPVDEAVGPVFRRIEARRAGIPPAWPSASGRAQGSVPMLNRLSPTGVYSSMMLGARMARWYVPRALYSFTGAHSTPRP